MLVKYYEVFHTGRRSFSRFELSPGVFWWTVNNAQNCAYSARKINGVKEYVILYTKDASIEKVSDLFDMIENGVLKWKIVSLRPINPMVSNTEISTGTSIGASLENNASNSASPLALPSQLSLF